MSTYWTRRQALATLLLAISAGSLAQAPPRVLRVGWLYTGHYTLDTPIIKLFLKELAELGHVQDRNLKLLLLRLSDSVAEFPVQGMLAQKPDILVVGDLTALEQLRAAGSTIPVVITWINDPVTAGFAASLAHPGGNVTGASGGIGSDLFIKRMELLRTVLPSLKRVAVLVADDPNHSAVMTALEAHGKNTGLSVISARAGNVQEARAAIELFARQHAGALVVLGGRQHSVIRQEIADIALRAKLPTIGNFRGYTNSGFLLSYGPSSRQQIQLAARYIDKIARGAKPGDLPIEQPTTFEFIINRKTAKALGIKLKADMLLRADEVIE